MRRLAAVGLLVGAAALVPWPAHADPVTVTVAKVAWWSSNPVAAAQPDGGFQVAQGPTGVESQAGIELSAPAADGLTGQLRLTQSGTASGAALQVCRTTAGWLPANPGKAADAPAADCSSAIPMAFDDGTKTWTAAIDSILVPGGTADLMIVPVGKAVVGNVFTPFTVSVSAVSVAASGTVAPEPPTTVVTDPPPTTPPSSGGGGGGGSFGTPSFDGGGSVSTPPVSDPAPATPPTTAGTVGADTAAGVVPAPVEQTPAFTPAVAPRGAGRPWVRLVFFLPLSAAAGAAAVFARKSGAAART